MKVKVTKKQINENYKNVICVGYCDLQNLLYFTNANYYTTRAEGWGCDIYHINYNTCITTGYAPFGNIRNYEIAKKYDLKAEKVLGNRTYKYETKKEKLENLIEQFITEIIGA